MIKSFNIMIATKIITIINMFSYAIFHLIFRAFLGNNTGPAFFPDANRVMECVITKLCNLYPVNVKRYGKCFPRWGLIISAYKAIRTNIINSAYVTAHSKLQLMEINQRTLFDW